MIMVYSLNIGLICIMINMSKIWILLLFFGELCAHEYSVNLMWIYKDKQEYEGPERSTYLFPARYTHPSTKETMDLRRHIEMWAQKNPRADLVVWYDGRLSTPNQLKATIELFASLEASLTARIKFRDIRSLPTVQKIREEQINKLKEWFKHIDIDQLSEDELETELSEICPFHWNRKVYFRADLARMIAAVDQLESLRLRYFVYADFDITPMTEEQIFDRETREKLDRFGVILKEKNCGDSAIYGNFRAENSFFVIDGQHENVIKSIREVVIAKNVQATAELYRNNSCRGIPTWMHKELGQTVYSSLQQMFTYLYYLEGYIQFIKDGQEQGSTDVLNNLKLFIETMSRDESRHMGRLLITSKASNPVTIETEADYFGSPQQVVKWFYPTKYGVVAPNICMDYGNQ